MAKTRRPTFRPASFPPPRGVPKGEGLKISPRCFHLATIPKARFGITCQGTSHPRGAQRVFARSSTYCKCPIRAWKSARLQENRNRGGCTIGNCGTALIVDDHADFRGLVAA